jgi:hypothetical protein
MLDAGTTVGRVEAVPCNPQSSAPITCHNSYLLYSTAFHPISKVTPCTHNPISIPTRPIPSLSWPRSSSRAQQSRLSSKNPSTVQHNTVQPHPHPLAPQVVPRVRRCNLHLTSDHQASASMHDTRTCMLLHGAGCGHVERGRGKTRLKWCAHRLPWARAPRLERCCSVARL